MSEIKPRSLHWRGRWVLYGRDLYAGLLTVLLGLVMVIVGPTYGLGTLVHLGAGFLPAALGAILVCLGIAIGVPAFGRADDEHERAVPESPQWLGWACIVAGPVLFIILGTYFGMIAGTFACVFVAALGDRSATLKSSLMLALFVTIFGVLLFSYVLRIQMPLLSWPVP